MILGLSLVLCLLADIHALQCGSCTNVTNPHDCRATTTCSSGDRCFTRTYGFGTGVSFDLGCRSEQACPGSGPSFIERSVGDCNQCCTVDLCNKDLCSKWSQVTNEVGVCADDPNYDCRQISSLFNICADTVHAKIACRKWCGLCDLVDGAWSLWSPWTTCDVTCGTGQLSRVRTCTDPPPAHGGLNCSGNSLESKLCTQSACPIHGGWSAWQPWSSCSNTCSIGTQSRIRACDNPVPQLAGNHCFGVSVDFRACFLKSCADGGWSVWSQWSNCTQGLRTKTRSCNNPPPSKFGKGCYGNNEETVGCTHHVAFTVAYPNGRLIEDRPIFTRIITNVGGGFDLNTSKFNCRIAGLYQFSLNFRANGTHYIYCSILKNGNAVAIATTSNDGSYDSGATSVYLQLHVGDEVYLRGSGGWNHVYGGLITSFSGALIE